MKKLLFGLSLILFVFNGVFLENSAAQGWYVDLDCGLHTMQANTINIDIAADCGYVLDAAYTSTREDWHLIRYGQGQYAVKLRLCFISDASPSQTIIKNVTVSQYPYQALKILWLFL